MPSSKSARASTNAAGARTSTSTSTAARRPIDDLPMHAFGTGSEFESWLDDSHTDEAGVYVMFAKKASGVTTMWWEEAVQVALCFGWIDGWSRGLGSSDGAVVGSAASQGHISPSVLDASTTKTAGVPLVDAKGNSIWHVRRFTPRRPRSLWSAKNVASAQRLIDEGRMRPAGLREVEAAKADGRWARAYAGPRDMQVPADFHDALVDADRRPRGEGGGVRAFFDGLNSTRRYAVLLKIHTAPNDKVRADRIKALIAGLVQRRVPGEKEPVPVSTPTKGTTGTKKAQVRGREENDDDEDEDGDDALGAMLRQVVNSEELVYAPSGRKRAAPAVTQSSSRTAKKQKMDATDQTTTSKSRRGGARSGK